MTSSSRGSRERPAADRPFSLTGAERWYVAQTLFKRECGAQSQLQAQGFRVFLPRVLRTVRHARRLRTIREPAFPGYLFCALDLQRDRWRSVNGTFGVARLIMGEEAPMPVPFGVVEALQSYVDPAGFCRFDRDLVAGQSVRVTVGPFAQAIGELVHLDAKGRVRVLLEIMGGKITATLDRSALVAV
ncbi:MAG TPA: transcription termination/antitermination NusG family protein [Methylocystis sp.]|nr:transcription termination/antitermination NusG family protein [Methylocystis sp.]